MPTTPSITLNNGLKMPAIGLGTYLVNDQQGVQAIKNAIDSGYRHFDTAYAYANEKEIGRGCKQKIAEGVVSREELFIVTKLWNKCNNPVNVSEAFKRSLENLDLDYIDLYLLHSPMSLQFSGFDIDPALKDVAICFEEHDYLDTWLAMEKLLDGGKVKSIGVSNFNSEQIRRICELGNVRPVTNQIECHPKLNQKKLIGFCRNYGIVITAYRPFEKFRDDGTKNTAEPLLQNKRIIEIGKKYNKSPAQVVLKYLVQVLSIAAIPKSTNEKHIKENINIFDFTLSEEDIGHLDSLNSNSRTCPFSSFVEHKHFPFNAEF